MTRSWLLSGRKTKQCKKIQKEYEVKQAEFLTERNTILLDGSGVAEEERGSGTPAIKGFWLQALRAHPACYSEIEEWDAPVLEYLSDISKSYIDDDDLEKGFKLTFKFKENPFFTNDVLWKEYYVEEKSPYAKTLEYKETKVSEIDWNAGKNVTVEIVKNKKKGGGAKKKAQKKEKEEPRDSFFRSFFRNLKCDGEIPDDINTAEARDLCEDEDSNEQMMALLMENDYEIGSAIADQIIPFGVRWYTGEASPDDMDDDDDSDDDDDDDDDDEDDDDDDDDEDEAPKASAKKRPGRGGKPEGGKQEECKQQ